MLHLGCAIAGFLKVCCNTFDVLHLVCAIYNEAQHILAETITCMLLHGMFALA
jgi:hypothetical protein